MSINIYTKEYIQGLLNTWLQCVLLLNIYIQLRKFSSDFFHNLKVQWFQRWPKVQDFGKLPLLFMILKKLDVINIVELMVSKCQQYILVLKDYPCKAS
jgi:hypothetical protein